MGSALSTFNDFMKATGPSFLTSAADVVNEAQKHNYLLRRFLKGADGERIIQGGSTIKDTLMFDEDSTFQFYLPNETFTWVNPQVLEEWEINWRFAVDHMSWTDQEVDLNRTSSMTRAARHQMYKDLKRRKEARLWTSILNGMESQLFAAPNTTNMESSTGKEPYSIPAFVNEFANGLWGTAGNGTAPEGGDTSLGNNTNASAGAFSTIEGLNPALQSKWVCQQVSYAEPAGTTASTSTNIPTNMSEIDSVVAAFDKMWTLVRFDPPPTKQEYFENGQLFGQFIACSRRGQNHYRRILRASQDQFVTASRQDPAYVKPQYAGIDLEYVSELDSAAIYHTTTTSGVTVTEDDYTNGVAGPRYYWLNAKYLCPVFHTTRYMYKHDPMRHPNQPFTTIQPIDSWYNMVCRSRRRLGIVYPSVDVFTL